MAISVTNIGTAYARSGANPSITVPAGGVPAGATIFLGVGDFTLSGGPAGSVTDTAGNTYSAIAGANPNNNTAKGFLCLFAAYNVSTLNSGDSITFTKANSSDDAAISAFYATGLATSPLDSAATATNTGSSASPTVTSGTPGTANDLFVGLVTCSNSSTTFTQDGTNGSWSSPFNQSNVGGGGAYQINGGFLVVADGTAHTYAPGFNISHSWAAIIAAFSPSTGDTLMGQAVM